MAGSRAAQLEKWMLRYDGAVWGQISKAHQVLCWLLCVLTLASAVDRVPDPPSLKPHHDATISMGVCDHDAGSADQHPGWELVSLCLSQAAGSFHSRVLVLSAGDLLLPSAIHVADATDSSPPSAT